LLPKNKTKFTRSLAHTGASSLPHDAVTMGKFRCTACHEWMPDDVPDEWAAEKWREELHKQGYNCDGSADDLLDMPNNYLDHYDRCPDCIICGAQSRAYPPPPPPRKRAPILDTYTAERFKCDYCRTDTRKRSAVRYTQNKWEMEDDENEGVDVPERDVNFTRCPRCLKSASVVVPCAGVEGLIIGRGGCNIKELERKFKCRCYDHRVGRALPCMETEAEWFKDNEHADEDEHMPLKLGFYDYYDEYYDDNDGDNKDVEFEFDDGKCHVTGHRKEEAAREVEMIVCRKRPAAEEYNREQKSWEDIRKRSAEEESEEEEEEDAEEEADILDVKVVTAEAAMAARRAEEDASRIDLTAAAATRERQPRALPKS
jgi:hypothetical protein